MAHVISQSRIQGVDSSVLDEDSTHLNLKTQKTYGYTKIITKAATVTFEF